MKKPKLTIAIIMQSPAIGGAEIYMHSLVSEFLKKGNNVLLATNNKDFTKLFSKSVKASTIPYLIDIIGNWKGLVKAILYLPLTLTFYSRLLSDYKKKGVDVILMSNFGEKMMVTFLSQFYRMSVVWIEYGRLETVFKNNFSIPKILYRALKDIPFRILVPSHNTEESLLKDALARPDKLTVVPCGTSVPTDVQKRSSRLSKILEGKFVIGNISRLTREKGQQVIIKAAPKIIKQVPNAFFILVGDGPDKDYFQSLIKKHELEKYFLLPGFVDDRDEYFGVMDLFIFPTVWQLEGFGVVTIEAMMRSIPVIASDYGPVPEIVDDGRTGVLFRVGDSDRLAKAVITLANDPSERERLGQNGMQKARTQYDIVRISDRVLSILRDATI